MRYTLWDNSTTPLHVDGDDGAGNFTLGTKFKVDRAATVTGIRFYKGSLETATTHTVQLWDAGGTQIGSGATTSEPSAGWQEATLGTPVAITAGLQYVVSYVTPNKKYAFEGSYFNADYVVGPLTAPSTGSSGGNGVFHDGPASDGVPGTTFNATNYWVDPVIDAAPTGTPQPAKPAAAMLISM